MSFRTNMIYVMIGMIVMMMAKENLNDINNENKNKHDEGLPYVRHKNCSLGIELDVFTALSPRI